MPTSLYIRSRAWLAPTLLILLACAWALPAAATPGRDGCTGFVHLDAEGRAAIASSGTWCLDQDLAGPIASDFSVRLSIFADDVVIDCRGFAVRADPARPRTGYGIRMLDHQRLTIRNCVIEGFQTGIQVLWIDAETRGLLIEDNVLADNNFAIETEVAETLIRRNRSRDSIAGIVAGHGASVIDNVVEGTTDFGIAIVHPTGGEICGNVVRLPDDASTARAIRISNADSSGGRHRAWIRDNVVVGGALGVGVSCALPAGRFADNVFTGVGTVNDGCTDAGDNDISP